MQNLLPFLKTNHSKIFQKGETVFKENELCQYLGVIKNGTIKISSFQRNGEEVIYNILGSGDMFGANLLFSSNPFYRGDVICTEKSEIILLSKNETLSLLTNNLDFLQTFLMIQSDFGKKVNLQVKLLSIKRIDDKFMYFLNINHNKIHVKNISNLASQLFVSREALSRLINKLLKNKIISYKNRIIEKL